MHYYKSLCAAVTICAQTHRQHITSLAYMNGSAVCVKNIVTCELKQKLDVECKK